MSMERGSQDNHCFLLVLKHEYCAKLFNCCALESSLHSPHLSCIFFLFSSFILLSGSPLIAFYRI